MDHACNKIKTTIYKGWLKSYKFPKFLWKENSQDIFTKLHPKTKCNWQLYCQQWHFFSVRFWGMYGQNIFVTHIFERLNIWPKYEKRKVRCQLFAKKNPLNSIENGCCCIQTHFTLVLNILEKQLNVYLIVLYFGSFLFSFQQLSYLQVFKTFDPFAIRKKEVLLFTRGQFSPFAGLKMFLGHS